ncbi:uncharacterized protein LOC107872489 isoform X2 [Capsicum annuum]|uniref:uncharacterized protein LOC107872489 isoform X2 n=1 Tax=Capsicum annuum TaxID=4072 RepID=UPI0007BFC566|nr:uncharacterized protein LOC107872489 isoform X2 [Capsicum annuum]
MAMINSLSAAFLITKSSSTARTIRLPPHRLLVLATSHDNISINNSTTTITNPLIGSTSKNKPNKVFEDKSTGVVCYRDENGEIICEGYDEGPRFPHQLPESPKPRLENQRTTSTVCMKKEGNT